MVLVERPVRPSLKWQYLGRVPYPESERIQSDCRESVRSGEGDRLLLLEHPHVYTLGRNSDPRDVRAGREWREARGVLLAECDRGGQATYHGPGQLVGYPILDLSPDRRDLRGYVRNLQEMLVRTLARVGIEAEPRFRQPEIGVWVGDRKIASLGVHVSRWITTHGFALNVSTDLSFFSGIVPCGMTDVHMTSIAELNGDAPPLPEVAGLVTAEFCAVFDYDPVELTLEVEAS